MEDKIVFNHATQELSLIEEETINQNLRLLYDILKDLHDIGEQSVE